MNFIDTRKDTSEYIRLCRVIRTVKKELNKPIDWFSMSFFNNMLRALLKEREELEEEYGMVELQ